MNILMKIYFRICNFIQNLIYKIIFRIKIGENVFFKGRPAIFKSSTSDIIIGKNTILNSSNYRAHVNIHSKCKLIADGENSKISIGSNSRIIGSCIHAHISIAIGNNCGIGANSQIIDSNAHKMSMSDPSQRLYTVDVPSPVTISDDVWIGANCIILPGTKIGAGSVICAGSVVRGHFPEKVLIGGNPATILKAYQ